MLSTDELSFKRRCANLLGLPAEEPLDGWEMLGFFQDFREQPTDLEPLFTDIPDGPAVYDRLLRVYETTSDFDPNAATVPAYFVVCEPRMMDGQKLRMLAEQQIRNWRGIADEFDHQELRESLSETNPVTIIHGAPANDLSGGDDSLGTLLYEVHGDWIRSLSSSAPHADWLREAFYSIACDYFLASYLMWPWYRATSSLRDPYEAYFELWRRGAKLRCESPQDLRLYAEGI